MLQIQSIYSTISSLSKFISDTKAKTIKYATTVSLYSLRLQKMHYTKNRI